MTPVTGDEAESDEKRENEEGEEMANGGRGTDVWQTKDLREGVFGSVAMIGLTG